MAFIRDRTDSEVWHAEHEANTPQKGDPAPDFELGDIDGGSRIRLSDFTGRKPVALVFGSFT